MSNTVKVGQRCPKCAWHITPANMEFHPYAFVTMTQYNNGERAKDFEWVNCTEPEPNTEYLEKYQYDIETGEWKQKEE